MNAKKLLTALALMFTFVGASAQHFMTNVEDATAQAEAEGKQVLLVFSGSDWCKPCIQLHREILSNPEFQQYAEEHLVLVNLDFPYQKKNQLSAEQQAYNEAKADQLNPSGMFPSVLLMGQSEETGKSIKFHPGMGVPAFVAAIERGTEQ